MKTQREAIRTPGSAEQTGRGDRRLAPSSVAAHQGWQEPASASAGGNLLLSCQDADADKNPSVRLIELCRLLSRGRKVWDELIRFS